MEFFNITGVEYRMELGFQLSATVSAVWLYDELTTEELAQLRQRLNTHPNVLGGGQMFGIDRAMHTHYFVIQEAGNAASVLVEKKFTYATAVELLGGESEPEEPTKRVKIRVNKDVTDIVERIRKLNLLAE